MYVNLMCHIINISEVFSGCIYIHLVIQFSDYNDHKVRLATITIKLTIPNMSNTSFQNSL